MLESGKYQWALKILINIFMKIYFFIHIAFPNYLMGSIISVSSTEIFFYKESKFQRPGINIFCVAGFQNEAILGDLMTFSQFFTHKKIQLFLQFSSYWSAAYSITRTTKLPTTCWKSNFVRCCTVLISRSRSFISSW